MELNIKDRIYIPRMLPVQGKFMEFNLKRSILKKVVLTEDDRKRYSIIECKEEGRVEWDINKDLECPLCADFTKEELDYLKKSCEALVESAYPDDFWITVEKIYDAANA